ncbi:MAG: hypothetical protein WD066_17760, partial [Planctomycetaceae bacterium]
LAAVDPESHESVRAAELPIAGLQPNVTEKLEQAAARLRVAAGAAPPAWTIERFAAYEGAAAIIRVADLLTVHAHDGSYRGRAVYTMRNRSRQYLPLTVPPSVRILSVMVKDPRMGNESRPARLVRGAAASGTGDAETATETLLVPIPQTGRSDLPFEVSVTFASTEADALPKGLTVRPGRVQPAIPRVVEPRGLDDPLGIAVERTSWRVYLPREYDAEPVDDPGRQNLSAADEATAKATLSIGLMKEQVELGKIATSKTESAVVRQQAYDNAKRLEMRLEELNVNEAAQSAVQQEFDRVKGVLSKVELDLDRQAAEIPQQDGGRREDERWRSLSNRMLANELFADEKAREVPPEMAAIAGGTFKLKSDGEEEGESESGDSKSGESKFNDSDPRRSLVQGKSSPEYSRSSLLERSQEQGLKQLEQSAQHRAKEEERFWEQKPSSRDLPPDNQPGDPFASMDPRRPRGPATEGQPGPSDWAQVGGQPADREFAGSDGAFTYGANAGFIQFGDEGRGPAGAFGPVSRGALSIDVDVPIPPDATMLTFTKVGGDPRLALAVRSRDSLETGFGLVWSLVWLAVGIGAAVAFHRAESRGALVARIAVACVAVGAIGFFLLPAPWSGWLLALAIAGGLVFASRRPAPAT